MLEWGLLCGPELQIKWGTVLPYGGYGGGFECNQSKLQLKI
jgi:hypothetical protein